MSTQPRSHAVEWRVGHVREQNVAPQLRPMFQAAIHYGDGNCLAVAYLGGDGALYADAKSVEETARRIVVAVNAHDGLLAACEAFYCGRCGLASDLASRGETPCADCELFVRAIEKARGAT